MEKNQLNKSGHREGYWEWYYDDSRKIVYEGNYNDGRRVGFWRIFNEFTDYKCYYVI